MMWENVIVTGANGQVGRELLNNLQGRTKKLVALVRKPVNLNATEIIPNWLNSTQAQEALSQAEIVVHLAGNLKPEKGDYLSANVKTTQTLISHLNSSQIKRVIFLSYVGANINSNNAYLATKGQAENLLITSNLPVTILRCSHIIGTPEQPGTTAKKMLSNNGKSVTILGSGKQKIQPVFLGDVVLGIIAAMEKNHDGIFDFTGSDLMTMDDFVKIINQNNDIKINHIPPFMAKILPLITKELTQPLIDIMSMDSLGNAQEFVDKFKFKFTSLKEEIWSKK